MKAKTLEWLSRTPTGFLYVLSSVLREFSRFVASTFPSFFQQRSPSSPPALLRFRRVNMYIFASRKYERLRIGSTVDLCSFPEPCQRGHRIGIQWNAPMPRFGFASFEVEDTAEQAYVIPAEVLQLHASAGSGNREDCRAMGNQPFRFKIPAVWKSCAFCSGINTRPTTRERLGKSLMSSATILQHLARFITDP